MLSRRAGRQRGFSFIAIVLLWLSPFAAKAEMPAPVRAATAISPERIEIRRQLWSASIENGTGRNKTSGGGLSPVYPVVTTRFVIINDAAGVRALDIDTGQSAWPFGAEDPGFLVERHSLAAVEPLQEAGGLVPAWCGTIVNGRWYGGIASRADSTGVSVFPRMLACLDLSAEGRVDWLTELQTVKHRRADRWVSGPPCFSPAHERIFLPVRSAIPPRAGIICLDDAGRLLWESSPVDTNPNVDRTALRDVLQSRDGIVFQSVVGVGVLGVDAGSGQLRWRTDFRTAPPPASLRTCGQNLVVFEDRLLAMSAAGLVALDIQTGDPLWQVPDGSANGSILGGSEGVVIVAGDWLWGVEVSTGKVRWQAGQNTEGSRSAGQGLLLSGSVVWPTQAELWTVEIRTGRILQRYPLLALTGTGGGNLSFSGSTLIVADRDRVSAFRVDVR